MKLKSHDWIWGSLASRCVNCGLPWFADSSRETAVRNLSKTCEGAKGSWERLQKKIRRDNERNV